MKCLITGAAGFIGSHLAEALHDAGHEVIGVDNLRSGRLDNLASLRGSQKFRFVDADVRDATAMLSCASNADWVFHLAGLADIVPSIDAPREYFDTNVGGTFNVLEAARAAGAKRFVYAASSSCYGIPDQYPTPETAPPRPQYPYALTKWQGEELVLHWSRVYRLPAISLRLYNVFGPRSRTSGAYGAVFGVFLAQKLAGRPFTVVGDGSQTRDFTYITDVTTAFVRAAESSLSGEALNVGSGGHYSINQLVELLGGTVEFIPKRPGEPDCTFGDVRLITERLGWRASVSFAEGVRRVVERIEDWREAPIWEPGSIAAATEKWFRYLGNDAGGIQ